MGLKGMIFDIDGTLVDSNDAHVRCWVEAFAHFGKSLDPETVRPHMGKGGDLLVPDLVTSREMRAFGKELKTFRSRLYKDNYLPHVKPFRYVRGLFETLHGRGIKLALASSSDEEEVKYYTGLLGVDNLLTGSTSKGDAEFSKPSPEIFQAALERIGTKTSNTITVGDTPYDILASHRAAMANAAVLSGGFEREDLQKAEFLFDNVEELVREIDRVDDYFNHE
jgi:HAD superfamily hydrolase (TIGR01549 family)